MTISAALDTVYKITKHLEKSLDLNAAERAFHFSLNKQAAAEGLSLKQTTCGTCPKIQNGASRSQKCYHPSYWGNLTQ